MIREGLITFPLAHFTLGQIVKHQLFGYRGVVVGVDPTYQGSDEWYERVAKSRPPKDEPWYNILVHDASHQTYVAERNLILDDSLIAINHPQLWLFFDVFEDGRYISKRMVH